MCVVFYSQEYAVCHLVGVYGICSAIEKSSSLMVHIPFELQWLWRQRCVGWCRWQRGNVHSLHKDALTNTNQVAARCQATIRVRFVCATPLCSFGQMLRDSVWYSNGEVQ